MVALKTRLMGLSPKEALFKTRRFESTDPKVQSYLEKVLKVFIEGYNLALATPDPKDLVVKLELRYEDHFRGFAYEGTGLYFAMMDLLFPTRQSRISHFTTGVAAAHDYIVCVGAGFAVARLPWVKRSPKRYLKKINPLLSWCVPDGYGFHQGVFHFKKYIEKMAPIPSALSADQQLLFDAGLGRSIWWVKGAQPVKIQAAINSFEEPRKAELWSGVGVALAYAGNGGRINFDQLLDLSGAYRADLLSGIPFACRMRQKGGNFSDWTEEVSFKLLSKSTEEAGTWIHAILENVLEALPEDTPDRGTLAYSKVREKLVSVLS